MRVQKAIFYFCPRYWISFLSWITMQKTLISAFHFAIIPRWHGALISWDSAKDKIMKKRAYKRIWFIVDLENELFLIFIWLE